VTPYVSSQFSPKELVSRWSEQAFEKVYSRYIKPVYSYIFRRVRNHHDAEDICAHVFVQAFDHLDEQDVESPKLASWLFTTARNASSNHSRRQRKFKATISLEEIPDSQGGADPSDLFLTSEQLREVLEALGRLPEERQRALILRLVDQLPHSEVAELLGRSEESSRVITHRALATLKRNVS